MNYILKLGDCYLLYLVRYKQKDYKFMFKNYFWNKASGLNADIQRHREEEQRLIEIILDLESKEPTEMNKARIRTYRNSLLVLQQSKAELLTKLGRKN